MTAVDAPALSVSSEVVVWALGSLMRFRTYPHTHTHTALKGFVRVGAINAADPANQVNYTIEIFACPFSTAAI